MTGLVAQYQISYYHVITSPVKKKLEASITTKGSRTWRPGEGVLLDGFVVGVEGGLKEKEEDGRDAASHFLDVADFVFGKGPAQEGLKIRIVLPCGEKLSPTGAGLIPGESGS